MIFFLLIQPYSKISQELDLPSDHSSIKFAFKNFNLKKKNSLIIKFTFKSLNFDDDQPIKPLNLDQRTGNLRVFENNDLKLEKNTNSKKGILKRINCFKQQNSEENPLIFKLRSNLNSQTTINANLNERQNSDNVIYLNQADNPTIIMPFTNFNNNNNNNYLLFSKDVIFNAF
jgi:hypothetical protein